MVDVQMVVEQVVVFEMVFVDDLVGWVEYEVFQVFVFEGDLVGEKIVLGGLCQQMVVVVQEQWLFWCQWYFEQLLGGIFELQIDQQVVVCGVMEDLQVLVLFGQFEVVQVVVGQILEFELGVGVGDGQVLVVEKVQVLYWWMMQELLIFVQGQVFQDWQCCFVLC